MAPGSGFAWTDASEEGQLDHFSVAVRTNGNMSILLVDFHVDDETEDNFSYQLSASISTNNGPPVICVTNPPSAKNAPGDPCIKNN
ncbi:MAG: hypothetical protein ACREPL_01275 [Rhodanobacteraceae bacterium]